MFPNFELDLANKQFFLTPIFAKDKVQNFDKKNTFLITLAAIDPEIASAKFKAARKQPF